MKKQIINGLATGFYFGKIPFMPGTFGTVWGIPLAWLLMKTGLIPYMVISVVFILIASFIAELHERYTHAHDPSEIVIDEVVGYVIAMTWLPNTWQSYLGAFIAFRFFDILKPFPIGAIDRRIKGGLGTVLDDVAAGLAANFVLQIIFMQTYWLGERWYG